AYGCDITFKSEANVDTDSMHEKKLIRLINMEPYSLPFADNTFDLIISNQVFEHVQNYSETIKELHRILKPEGSAIHIFPSRYSPIEPHVYVPFSSIVNSYPWLLLWAFFGVRNGSQSGLSAKEVAINNRNYLRDNTNYLSKRKINQYFKSYFESVEYCESLFLKYSPRGLHIYNLSKLLPFLPALYGHFRMRVLITRLPK
ncbi:MAG TPA: methyltransferase domain-containing protein, partial [Gammaproteobacteria bacterium]|nr:methyltransferase domain-containing protein [Gammaproteobacteria bacterium]